MAFTAPDPYVVLDCLSRVRPGRPGEWMAECPCHEDRTPSLHITQKLDEDGAILLYCHGCQVGIREFCEVIGISPTQLFPRSEPRGSSGQMVLTATYTYENSAGEPVMQTLRYRTGDGHKTFRAKRNQNDVWEWGAPENPADRPLYRLPEVLKQVAAGGEVFVVEGEKDVETLRKKGEVATTNPFGAGKWLRHHTESLAGATVVVIADKDDSGLAHALHVASELRKAGSAVEVLRAATGKDVSDHIGAGLLRKDLEIVPEGVEDEFTRFVELLNEFDSTLPTSIRFEMAREALSESLEGARPDTSTELSGDSDRLVERLKSFRSDKAREKGIPPYCVFHNATVEELVKTKPRNRQELLEVKGIGPSNSESYGDEILQILWEDSHAVSRGPISRSNRSESESRRSGRIPDPVGGIDSTEPLRHHGEDLRSFIDEPDFENRDQWFQADEDGYRPGGANS